MEYRPWGLVLYMALLYAFFRCGAESPSPSKLGVHCRRALVTWPLICVQVVETSFWRGPRGLEGAAIPSWESI